MPVYPPPQFTEIGLHGQFKKAAPNEWHGECPFCGGRDRFVIFTDREYPSWNYFCRQCSPDGGWVDEINPRLKEISPAKRAELAARHAEQAEYRLKAEIERAKSVLEEVQQARAWLRYHEQLTQQARNKWESWGIPEFWQDFYKLGYDPDRIVYSRGQEWHTPTMTIPVFAPGWEVMNVRHRLLRPPTPGDKYRPERAGLPTTLFIADPDKPVKGKTLLVEGEKKSMVSYITADDYDLQVVGIPGKNVKAELIDQMKDADPVYICLDPDASREAHAIALDLGPERSRIIELPGKIDDLIIDHGLDGRWIKNMMRQAVRV